jgi:SAM-dependent methyltransferase
MNEAAKTFRLLSSEEQAYLTGKGIDIGCGDSPINSTCRPFDIADGDANHITNFVHELESFDYVVSFHCLEHIRVPEEALQDWWTLVRRGGVMMIVVPDEDLYEQGYWPSLFNRDHKATFTIEKRQSWSPASRNVANLARTLQGAEVLTIRLQDDGYDLALLAPGAWPRWFAKLCYMLIFRIDYYLPWAWTSSVLRRVCRRLKLPVDQTLGDATAQILLVVRKT